MQKKLKKKNKIKIFPVLIFLFICVIGYFLIQFVLDLPTKNIFIYGNSYVSDQEIIDIAGLDNYPSFLSTKISKLKKKIIKNDYIESVDIKRRFFNVFEITVREYHPLFYKDTESKMVFSNTLEKEVDTLYLDIPVLVNYVPDTIYNSFVDKVQKLNKKILEEISEIEYTPNEYDDSRFILYMNDGNYIYINLDRFANLDYYNDIFPTLEGNKGILYLDSGNHFEPFK